MTLEYWWKERVRNRFLRWMDRTFPRRAPSTVRITDEGRAFLVSSESVGLFPGDYLTIHEEGLPPLYVTGGFLCYRGVPTEITDRAIVKGDPEAVDYTEADLIHGIFDTRNQPHGARHLTRQEWLAYRELQRQQLEGEHV